MKTKLMSLVLTLALLCSVSTTVFAADPSSTAADGNLLDYAIETVVVPTALKMTLNPNEYPVNTKYEEVAASATFDATTTYYTESGGTYSVATGLTAFTAGTKYYTAVQSTNQVVSFNYGIASKATTEKKVTLSLAASYTANGDKTGEITFVDSLAKAQPYSSTNADGAKRGELKIYLEAVAAGAAPSAKTHVKTADTALDSNKTYYTKAADGSFTEVAAADLDVAKIGTYYEYTTAAIGVEIAAGELADVTMTNAGSGAAAFAAGTDNAANAKIAFKLAPATYTIKSGEIVDFSTTMSGLNSKLEMTAIGGVTAFTLTGAINKDADWTKSKASAIKITPTYEIVDATGDETADGGLNQISVAPPAPPAPAAAPPSIAITSYTANGTDPVVISVSLGSGNLAATAVVSALCLTPQQEFLDNTIHWDATAKKVTVDAGAAQFCAENDEKVTLVFDDTARTSVDITFTT